MFLELRDEKLDHPSQNTKFCTTEDPSAKPSLAKISLEDNTLPKPTPFFPNIEVSNNSAFFN
jgi:hypothetical protein